MSYITCLWGMGFNYCSHSGTQADWVATSQMLLIAELEGKENSGPQVFKCSSPEVMCNISTPSSSAGTIHIVAQRHRKCSLQEWGNATLQGPRRWRCRNIGRQYWWLPHSLCARIWAKRGKMWSQSSRYSQSNQRNIWRCAFIPCGVDFRGSSKRPIIASVSEVTVWHSHIFLQNIELFVMVVNLLHNGGDK